MTGPPAAARLRALACALAAAVLSACGQRGPLVLPGGPPEVAPVAAPAAGDPQADDDDDDSE